jgi:cell fate regulator YaaT (PSP1 superfamily)
MPEIVGVRFRNAGKVYYFDPDGLQVAKGQSLIVETTRGVECGEAVIANRQISDSEHTQSLKKVLRVATEEDMAQIQRNRDKEAGAMKICAEKIRKHNLDMKLIGAEYTFDNNKLLFYFTADGRVDFRDLVKDLASVLRIRIELRQIGVRDEAKMLGGLGICGRPFCCSTFLGEFQPVSIKMAKEQGLSLNPTKISGTCGRLMCCLKYEQNAYEDLMRTTPRQGSIVQTADGKGTIIDVALMTGILKVAVENGSGYTTGSYHKDQVKVLQHAKNPPPLPRRNREQPEDAEGKR